MEKTEENLKRENSLINKSFSEFQVEKVLALNESFNEP